MGLQSFESTEAKTPEGLHGPEDNRRYRCFGRHRSRFRCTKPKSFTVQRTINVKTPPDKIFVLINDFHNWNGWAPQDREDPTMKGHTAGPKTAKARSRIGIATAARAKVGCR